MELKAKLSTVVSRLCMACLALLGFNCSCDNGKCMYGTPTGSFEIKGTVTNEQGSPVQDALIRVTETDIPSTLYSYAKGLTNSDGYYTVSGKGSSFDKIKIVCIPYDNALQPDSVIVPVDYQPNKESKKDSWNIGHADMTINFVLKPTESAQN